jgi:hypothetical protein
MNTTRPIFRSLIAVTLALMLSTGAARTDAMAQVRDAIGMTMAREVPCSAVILQADAHAYCGVYEHPVALLLFELQGLADLFPDIDGWTSFTEPEPSTRTEGIRGTLELVVWAPAGSNGDPLGRVGFVWFDSGLILMVRIPD